MRTQLTLSQELKLFAASVLLGVAVYSCSGQELSTFYTAEIYNQTGEVKSGFGLRARYWWKQWGIEADGMSIGPRDSIIDRVDVSGCYRLPLSHMWTAIGSVGYGYDHEDSRHGPGAGASIQYGDRWLGELSARVIYEEEPRTLLGIGIGRRF